jgi:hypothetical protein
VRAAFSLHAALLGSVPSNAFRVAKDLTAARVFVEYVPRPRFARECF